MELKIGEIYLHDGSSPIVSSYYKIIDQGEDGLIKVENILVFNNFSTFEIIYDTGDINNNGMVKDHLIPLKNGQKTWNWLLEFYSKIKAIYSRIIKTSLHTNNYSIIIDFNKKRSSSIDIFTFQYVEALNQFKFEYSNAEIRNETKDINNYRKKYYYKLIRLYNLILNIREKYITFKSNNDE
jgi:hypothetical protein